MRDKESTIGISFATGSLLALAMAAQGGPFAQGAAHIGRVVAAASRVQAAGFTAPTSTSVLGAAVSLRRKAAMNETV